ncbi:glycosyltransferase 87 family protein [Streptomyces sp. GZWMJZ-114]|uniref:glycosyltransferase 87 family protein n=1 Tax=unclassified Streptomyces TaxID=2593676 RepID=UPI0019D6B3DB|nr:glycosyltransferase 87 family protein [Streptomyces sp. GZWMJZ-114]
MSGRTGRATWTRTGGALAVWAATRTLLLLWVLRVIVPPGLDVTYDVSGLYVKWAKVLSGGVFPEHDVTWQYPPGAALAVLAPKLLPFLSYATAFYVLALVCDALVTALLLYAATRPGRRFAGVWVWVVGVALLGPVVFARYDVMVTALSVAALLAGTRRARAFGALAALGAVVKVWPVLLLVGTPRGEGTRRSWTSAAVTGLVLLAGFGLLMPGSLSFLTAQRDRGTEVESLGALVFHFARHFGWDGRVAFHYGSMEFLGTGVPLVSALAQVLSVLALCWLVLWRVRARVWSEATFADAAFTALLLFTTTSRVISPQYMVWLLGLGAVCLVYRGGRMTLPVVLTVIASFVTWLEFPVYFGDVIGSTPFGIGLLVVRNGLLVAATVLACRALWRETVRAVPRGGSAESERMPGWATTDA